MVLEEQLFLHIKLESVAQFTSKQLQVQLFTSEKHSGSSNFTTGGQRVQRCLSAGLKLHLGKHLWNHVLHTDGARAEWLHENQTPHFFKWGGEPGRGQVVWKRPRISFPLLNFWRNHPRSC